MGHGERVCKGKRCYVSACVCVEGMTERACWVLVNSLHCLQTWNLLVSAFHVLELGIFHHIWLGLYLMKQVFTGFRLGVRANGAMLYSISVAFTHECEFRNSGVR